MNIINHFTSVFLYSIYCHITGIHASHFNDRFHQRKLILILLQLNLLFFSNS